MKIFHENLQQFYTYKTILITKHKTLMFFLTDNQDLLNGFKLFDFNKII